MLFTLNKEKGTPVDGILGSPHQHIIGHFGDEFFQSITCTGTDNLTRSIQETKHTNNIT